MSYMEIRKSKIQKFLPTEILLQGSCKRRLCSAWARSFCSCRRKEAVCRIPAVLCHSPPDNDLSCMNRSSMLAVKQDND